MNNRKCHADVYEYGELVGAFYISGEAAERLCADRTESTGRLHDWHFSGGRVFVKAMPQSGVKSSPAPRRITMHSDLYSEGLKHLAAILLKAQGMTDRDTGLDIDAGREVQRLRKILDEMNAALSQQKAEPVAEIRAIIDKKEQP